MAGEKLILMDPETIARLERLLQLPAGSSATGTPGGARPPVFREQPLSLKYKAVIQGSAPDPSAPGFFLYAHSEIKKTSPGPDGWTFLAGGRAGTTALNPAHNWAEGHYGGRLANGILIANLPSTFTQPPVPIGSVVEMEIHQNPDGTPEYWFERGTVPDGVCP